VTRGATPKGYVSTACERKLIVKRRPWSVKKEKEDLISENGSPCKLDRGGVLARTGGQRETRKIDGRLLSKKKSRLARLGTLPKGKAGESIVPASAPPH